MKSPSGFCSGFEGTLSGFNPRITSQRSLMPSPSESQWTGFVPMANSSRSVRPSLSVSRVAMSPLALTVGSNAFIMSSAESGSPFVMLFNVNFSPVSCTHLSPSIQPTAARYQK